MKKYWWIVSVVIHTTGWDGLPDSESYPVEKKEVFKFFGSNDQAAYEGFREGISNLLTDKYKNERKKLDFVWCLGEKGEEELNPAEELMKYLKTKLAL